MTVFLTALRSRVLVALVLPAVGVLVAVNPLRAQDLGWEAGPYLGHTTRSSTVINWITRRPSAGKVRIMNPTDGTSRVLREDTRRTIHEVRVAGLEANTRYAYRVLDFDAPGGNPGGKFWTAPRGPASFSFVVMGDTRSNHKTHRAVARRIIADVPDRRFVLNSGDMVSKGTRSDDWRTFFEITADLTRNSPYYTVIGNHESNAKLYFQLFSMPENGPHRERNYSFDYGGVHVTVLDTNMPYRINAKQRAWMEADLRAAATADFRVVSFHHPPHGTQKSRAMEHRLMRILFARRMADLGVDVVFNGHDHHYIHAVEKGVHYVLTAGGGAGLYELGKPTRYTRVQKKVHHYCRVDVEPGKLTVRAIDINGKEFDSFTIDRREKHPLPAPRHEKNPGAKDDDSEEFAAGPIRQRH